MKRLALTLLTCIFLLCTATTKAQDYRSASSGNWNALGTWEQSTDGGTTWGNASATPTNASGPINIRNGHVVTVTATVNLDDVTIEAGGTVTTTTGGTGWVIDNGTFGVKVFGTFNAGFGGGSFGCCGAVSVESGGVVNMNAGGAFYGPTTVQPGGTVIGNTPINMGAGTVVNNGTWTMNGSNALTNSAGGTFTNNGVLTLRGYSLGGTLANNGTIHWSAGTITGGGNIQNASGAVFNIGFTSADQLQVPFTNQAGATVNQNGAGTFNTFYFSTYGMFTNAGTINLVNGNWLSNNTFNNTGIIDIPAGRLITFNSTTNLNAGTTFTGTGAITSVSTTNQNFPWTNTTHSLTLSGGSWNNSAGNPTVFGVGSSFNWTGGALAGTGNYSTQPGFTTTISTATGKALNSTFTNNATINWAGGAINGSGNFQNTSGAVFNINFTAPDQLQVPFTNQAGATVNQNGSGTFNTWYYSTFGVFTNAGTINLVNGNWHFNNTNTHSASSTINISSSRTLTFNTAATLAGMVSNSGTLAGTITAFTGPSFTNNGIVTLTNLPFAGTSAQQLNGTGSIAALTINNANGVTLGGTQTVTGTLTFTNGRITLGNNDLLLSNTALGGLAGTVNATNRVVTDGTGAFHRQIPVGGSSYPFPIGTASSYLPVTLSNTSGPAERFGARVQNEVYNEYGASGVPTGDLVVNDQVERTWVITEATEGGNQATVQLQWNTADEGTNFGRSNCALHTYNGTDWVAGALGAASGSNPYMRSLAGVSGFREFTVADGESNLPFACPGGVTPGSPCDDGSACTTNDVIGSDCLCSGLFQDSDNDGTCNAEDGCPNDVNKIAPGACGCGVADVPASYYVDADGDGYGTGPLVPGFFTCEVPAGYAAVDGDCDDGSAAVNPGATEACDGLDNDCNGTVDDLNTFGIGLVGHWAFNGDLNDRTDNANNGSAPSGTTYTTGIDGMPNGAFQFGGGRYVVVPHNAAYNFGTGDFTYSVWLNWGSTSYGSVIDKNNYGNGIFGLNCFVDYPSAGNFMGRPGELAAGTGLGNNTWHHVVMTRTGTTMRIYLNGALSATTTIASTDLNNTSNIFIGVHGSTSIQHYSGKMDNLRLYNRAITAQEVTDLYTHEQTGNLDGVGNVTFYTDADGDGYGDPATADTDCEQPPGTVLVGGDCADNNANIHPGASEVCDGADNDCANGVDDGLTMVNYWPDSDGDGFGDESASVVTACAPPSGHVTNNTDACPNEPLKQVAGACGCGNLETDRDTDGAPDCIDGCPTDPLKTASGQCGCGNPDTDSDMDGTADCNDACPNDPLKTTAGHCGCGIADTDDDADGTANCNDGCPSDPLKLDPGTCGCGVDDAMFTTWYPDADGDGYGDPYGAIQNCNATPPAGHVAIEGDCDDNNNAVWQNTELYVDVDGDGYDWGMEWVCYGASVPAGYTATTSGADCNDADANLTAQGNPCDDGNAGTANSFVTGNCQCVAPPVNDLVCDAIPLSFGMNGPFTNVGATLEPGEPTTYDQFDCFQNWCTPADQTAWFSIVAPAHGRVDLNFGEGTWDSQIAVWSAADCNALLAGGATLLGASDKTGSFFSIGALDNLCLTPGTTYYVQVDAGDADGIASFELHLIDSPVPATMVASPTSVVSGESAEIGFSVEPGTTVTYRVDGGPPQTLTIPDWNAAVSTGPLSANTTYELLSAELNGCSQTFTGVTATVTVTANEDCAGVPNGPAMPGTPCDDGSACTTNDLYDAGCNCAGTFQDADGDLTCDAEDGCPADPNKTAAGQCGCGNTDTDSDSDGIADCVDNCPAVPGQIGSPCNDGNTLTTGETLQADCTCGGGVDCNGTVNGTAYHDNCGTCVGGTTGLVACVADCNGVFGGTAAIDQCGVCAGGNTGVVPNSGCLDCAGVPNGGHVPDSCGTCLLPTDPAFSTAVHTLAYSGNSGFTASLINPQTGSPAGTYTVEAIYTNSEGAALPIGYPRAVLDYEGNGHFTGPWDRTVLMTAVDPADNNTADGKLYRASVVGLAAGTNWQTRIVTQSGNCVAQIGPFNYPDVLDAPDVAIYANDISFSTMNPAVSSPLTVTATVRNQSNQPALNVSVSLLNQFDPGTSYPVQYIGAIPANGVANVVWNITTPAVPAWCPMQVTADADGSIVESNELNNAAIRPFTNGDFDVPGGIVITAATDPAHAYQGTNATVAVHGRAWYTGTAVPMADSSVAGATVTAQVVGGGSYSGTTDATGHYVIAVPANGPLGLTNLNVSTTDYTLVSSTVTTSYTQHPPLSCLPDLVVQTVGDQSAILAGGTFTGQFIVSNAGCAATTVNTILTVAQTGGDPIAAVTVPPLAPGAQYVSAFSTTFSTAGSFTVCGTADGGFLVEEESENNMDCASINVLPLGPDLVAGSVLLGSSQLCNAQQPQFSISNGGTAVAAASTAEVIVRLNGVTQQTFTQAVGPLASGATSTFTLPYNYPGPGTYTFEVHCDVPYPNGVVAEANEGNNTALYSLVMAACAPDLAVVGCGPAVNPVDPAFPGTVDYAITLRNEGSLAVTGPVDIAFNVTGQPPVMGQLTGSLAPNAQTTITVTAASVAPATATLTVVADPANSLNELSEANNSLGGGLCVDLKPDSLCFLGQNFWEASYPLNGTMVPRIGLRSLGLYKASQAVVRFEVSGPGIAGTALLGDVTVTNLNPTCNCPLPVMLPSTFLFSQVGTYTFTMTADPLGAYTECSEANNVMVRSVEVTNVPDLRVLSEYIAPSLLNPDPGEPITLSVTYDNMGASNLGDLFELSVAVDEVPHATVLDLPGLLSGMDNTVAIPATWSSNTVGVHVIRARVDAGDQVAELNEGNNEATRTIVVGAAANLHFTAFTPSANAPAPGTEILIQAAMANAGEAPVNAELHCFFVTSLQDTLPIGSATFALAANGSTTVNMPWTVTEVPVEILGRITNATVLEFNYNDNGAAFFLDAFDIALAATPGCAGGADGSLSAEATNGAAPYTYSWSNGAGSSTIAAQPGEYTVYVVDAMGRTASAAGTIPVDVSDSDSDGTADCNDACPADPLKTAPGACGCGTTDVPTTWYADADGDGFGDPNAGQAGFTCDQPNGHVADNTDLCDGDATKTAPGACGCGTTDVPTTWYADADGDGFGDPNAGQAGFTCDQPNGHVADNTDLCPGVSGTVGSACDDGNANTNNDQLDGTCTCVGTPIIGPCTGNQVVVNITTDADPAQVSWEIRGSGNVLLATGTPAVANSLNSATVCLGTSTTPACYTFALHDSFGDGISGGGWELRTTAGELILKDDFATGSASPASPTASASYGSGHAFCLPLGTARPSNGECDIFTNVQSSKVYCNKVTGATQYQFEFSNPDAGFIRRIVRSTNYVHFWDMVTNPLVPGVRYFARVRTNVSGPVTSAHWGSGCEMGLAPGVPCTQLIPAPNFGHSCNETRAFNKSYSYIYATPVAGATRYEFRIYNASEGYEETFIRNTYILQLKWNSSVAPPLLDGSTYNVAVSVRVGGVWSTGCTGDCTITIENGGSGMAASVEQTGVGVATLWPNPVRGGEVNLSITDLRDHEQKITVDVQDLYGKQVYAREYDNSGERFGTILQLPGDLASGVYLVSITVNGERTVQRLSIVR